MRVKNITVTVSEEAWHQARIWAAQHDTSISAVVQYLIQTLPGIPRAARAFPEPYPVAAKATPFAKQPPSKQNHAVFHSETVKLPLNPSNSRPFSSNRTETPETASL